MVTMAQSAANWRNMHTHYYQTITICKWQSLNKVTSVNYTSISQHHRATFELGKKMHTEHLPKAAKAELESWLRYDHSNPAQQKTSVLRGA